MKRKNKVAFILLRERYLFSNKYRIYLEKAKPIFVKGYTLLLVLEMLIWLYYSKCDLHVMLICILIFFWWLYCLTLSFNLDNFFQKIFIWQSFFCKDNERVTRVSKDVASLFVFLMSVFITLAFVKLIFS
jgi:hypothetical protein